MGSKFALGEKIFDDAPPESGLADPQSFVRFAVGADRKTFRLESTDTRSGESCSAEAHCNAIISG